MSEPPRQVPPGVTLPELIRRERVRLGWSQRVLAKQLRVSHGAVAQWETGDTKPKLVNVLEMFSLFGIAADQLTAPGSPYFGQIVDDAEELALLNFWRRLRSEDRRVVLRLLSGTGLGFDPPHDVPPKPSRKRRDVAN